MGYGHGIEEPVAAADFLPSDGMTVLESYRRDLSNHCSSPLGTLPHTAVPARNSGWDPSLDVSHISANTGRNSRCAAGAKKFAPLLMQSNDEVELLVASAEDFLVVQAHPLVKQSGVGAAEVVVPLQSPSSSLAGSRDGYSP